MRWWWDNTIIPLEDAFADEIETQMFPAFGLDAAEYRLAWDRSKIPALQEDESAKHAMWREDYRAGGIDRYTYLTKIGEQADEKLKGVLHPSATPKSNEDEVSSEVNTNQKRLEAALKLHDFHEEDWERAGGMFHHYVGGAFWGGEGRDSVTKEYFNGKYEVTVHDGVDAASEKLFGRKLKPAEYGQLIGAPDKEKIDVHRLTSGILIQVGDQGNFNMLTREVGRENGELILNNQMFSKSARAPKQLAPRMLAYQFRKCMELGITKVAAYAVGDANARQTGYSRWPQLGFNGKIDDVVRSKLPPQYRAAKDLNQLMQMEGGFDAWQRHGGKVNVLFDLHPDSESWKIFNAYLKDKGIKVGE